MKKEKGNMNISRNPSLRAEHLKKMPNVIAAATTNKTRKGKEETKE